jgi:hypothetical protein
MFGKFIQKAGVIPRHRPSFHTMTPGDERIGEGDLAHTYLLYRQSGSRLRLVREHAAEG